MTSSIQRILDSTQEGIPARNNTPANYLPLITGVLRAAAEERFDSAPAPLCVQVQVSAECTTRCTMCDHHRPRSSPIVPLTLGEWQALFDELSNMGVRSLVLSGGEPLANPELPQLIEAADRAKLAVGLLTSGTLASSASEAERNRCISVIAKKVSWVAISIDGIDAVEGKIRTPVDQQDDRWKSLQHFTMQLLGEKPDLKLSATVTLQKANIDMDLEQACRRIQAKDGLNIKSVFFKFATGSISALELRKPLSYLLAASDLQSFEEFLYNNALANEDDNNLKYLRRMFAAGFFSKSGITNGAPVADFYEERLAQQRALQCFTPFLFSLVDTDGSVYPCCHLYRDNHGENPNSIQLRRKHRMGSVRGAGGFKSVWNGKAYADERRNLVRINPNDPNYTPCGECTRHCRHNLVLTEVLIEYKQNPEDAIQKLGKGSADPVWF
jgi:MoaA/NifB/PqqE/SkfB family radical SAM enzyme